MKPNNEIVLRLFCRHMAYWTYLMDREFVCHRDGRGGISLFTYRNGELERGEHVMEDAG